MHKRHLISATLTFISAFIVPFGAGVILLKPENSEVYWLSLINLIIASMIVGVRAVLKLINENYLCDNEKPRGDTSKNNSRPNRS